MDNSSYKESCENHKKKQSREDCEFLNSCGCIKIGGEAIYAASKAAINLITQIFGIESSDFGITVNALFQPWLKQI